MNSLFQMDVEDFKQKVDNLLLNLYVTEKESTCNLTRRAKEELKELFTNNNFDVNQVVQQIHKRKWDIDKTTYFVNELNKNRTKLLYLALAEYNNTFGECTTEFGWAIKLLLGTSELKELSYPLMQLILKTNKNGVMKRNIYELSQDVLVKLISELEKI